MKPVYILTQEELDELMDSQPSAIVKQTNENLIKTIESLTAKLNTEQYRADELEKELALRKLGRDVPVESTEPVKIDNLTSIVLAYNYNDTGKVKSTIEAMVEILPFTDKEIKQTLKQAVKANLIYRKRNSYYITGDTA